MNALLFSRPHFGLIRQRVLVAAGVVGAAALLAGLAQWQALRARDAHAQAQQQLQAVQAELAQVRVSDDEVEANLRRYRTLVGEGFIGPGDRVAWTEALLDEQLALGLPPLRFELAPRRALADEGAPPADPSIAVAAEAPPTPGVQLHDLRFEAEGLHEGELLALLQRLRARRLGHFRVQDCQLKRSQGTGLTTDCMLRFFTFLPAAAVAAPAGEGAPP